MKIYSLKNKLVFAAIISSLFFFTMCKKEIIEKKLNESPVIESTHDADFAKFAKILSDATEDVAFRNVIKENAMLQKKGDYDILLEDLFKLPIKPSSKNNGKEITIGVFLKTYYMSINKNGGLSDFLDSLITVYPDMQISVPVYCEDWNPETFIPGVVFVPENIEEGVTETVPGYISSNKSMQQIEVDAINTPDDPYIVLRHAENPPNVLYFVWQEISAPTNLTANQSEVGINLSWSSENVINETGNNNISKYILYKKGSAETQYYVRATIYGVNNRSFSDNEVQPGHYYDYYIVAANPEYTSPVSNYVYNTQAPGIPNAVASFDAIHNYRSWTELRWTHGTGAIGNTVIERSNYSEDSYTEIADISDINTHEYFDNTIVKGSKYSYRASNVLNGNYISNPEYDIAFIPYRNIDEVSHLYVTRITVDESQLSNYESWLGGRPEFLLTISTASDDTHEPIVIADKIDIQMATGWINGEFVWYTTTPLNIKVDDWMPGSWYNTINFSLVEYDRSISSFELNIPVKYKFKEKTLTEPFKMLLSEGGVSTKISFENKLQNCGSGKIHYYDPSSKEIELSYGIKLLIEDN